jgi:biopolymer transport protein ExbB/TolQ
MYGMSSEEFWEDDPQLYWAYRIFYMKKLEQAELETDYKCWLTGFYTFNALSESLAGMFDKEKPHSYIEKPISMKMKEIKKEEEENIDPKVRQQTKCQEDFNKWARY